MSLGRTETYHRQRDDEARIVKSVRAVSAARIKQKTVICAARRYRGDVVPAEQFSGNFQETLFGVAESEE